MGENGGKTTGQVLSHGSCACLAWCSMSLAHIQRVGSAGLAVTDDRNGRCRKIPFLQGKTTKGWEDTPRMRGVLCMTVVGVRFRFERYAARVD